MRYSSPVLQYTNVDVTAVINRGTDLFITESSSISAAQLSQLTGAGVMTLAYMNACVTDASRAGTPLWNSGWTVDGSDTGALTASAPQWLQSGILFDFTGDAVADARLVDFSYADWSSRVVGEAVRLKTAGYGGIFLDDAGTYWTAADRGLFSGNAVAAATAMLALIDGIRAAVGSAFLIYVNGSPYLGTDAGDNARLTAAIDGMILEGYAREANAGAFREHTRTYILPTEDVINIDYASNGTTTLTREQIFEQMRIYEDLGATSFFSNINNYNNLGPAAGTPTTGNDVLFRHGLNDTVAGGLGDDRISTQGGNDIVSGGDGDDVILAGGGNDTVNSGIGNDTLYGGRGADQLDGGAGADRLVGGDDVDRALYTASTAAVSIDLFYFTASGGHASGDTLQGIELLGGSAYGDVLFGDNATNVFTGLAGDDRLYGRNGVDRLIAGDGADLLYGGSQADLQYGGRGNDTFYYKYAVESDAANLDLIFDFTTGDRMALTAVDANALLTGDQNFSFIGSGSFNAAGQVRVVDGQRTVYGVVESGSYVHVSTDADTSSEMVMFVLGRTAAQWSAVDFAL